MSSHLPPFDTDTLNSDYCEQCVIQPYEMERRLSCINYIIQQQACNKFLSCLVLQSVECTEELMQLLAAMHVYAAFLHTVKFPRDSVIESS